MQVYIYQRQGMGRKMMNVQFCLRDELHLEIVFVTVLKLTSRQYEKYWCVYIRRKNYHGLVIFSCLT